MSFRGTHCRHRARMNSGMEHTKEEGRVLKAAAPKIRPYFFCLCFDFSFGERRPASRREDGLSRT